MATEKSDDRSGAAFFRWQEWQSARRHVMPATEEARGDLLAAEAHVLAQAAERDAARDAAALARAHYEAAAPSAALEAKTGQLRELWESLGGPVETVAVAEPDAASEVAFDPRRLGRQIERLVAGLTARQAGGVLRTINALASTSAQDQTDPLAIQHVVVTVSPRRSKSLDVTDLVNQLGTLRWHDPVRFDLTLAALRRRAGHDDPASDGLQSDESA